jgi:hypothetical protein
VLVGVVLVLLILIHHLAAQVGRVAVAMVEPQAFLMAQPEL